MLLSGLLRPSRPRSAPGSGAAFGSIVGVLRTLSSKTAGRIGFAYVELFRNMPLLVQLFLWYFVLPEVVPHAWGLWLKQLPNAPFYTAVLGIGLFMSARVAEQVRAGINSLPRGQGMAGTALGLTTFADLSLRAAADGVSDHPAAADLGIPQHHQEHFGGADDRPAELTGEARAMQEFSFQVSRLHGRDPAVPADQPRRRDRYALARAPVAVPGYITGK